MSIYWFHPLNKDNTDGYSSYSKHGCGKLDWSDSPEPMYAMCDGKVYVGTYNDGVSYCCLECTDNPLGITFYIRYLHGTYCVSTGQTVKKGDQLGTTSNIGATGVHLHIDFSTKWNDFVPVKGSIDGNSFVYNGKAYEMSLASDGMKKINKWYGDNGQGGGVYGYCWVVMAGNLMHSDGNSNANESASSSSNTECTKIPSEYYNIDISSEDYKSYITAGWTPPEETSDPYSLMLDYLTNIALGEVGTGTDEFALSCIGLYGKLFRARLIQQCILNTTYSGMYQVIEHGGFVNHKWSHTSSRVGSDKASKYIEVVSNNLLKPSNYYIISDHSKIADSAPFYNYGHSTQGYGFKQSVEQKLYQAIISGAVTSHLSKGTSKLCIGCAANTSYYALNDWI